MPSSSDTNGLNPAIHNGNAQTTLRNLVGHRRDTKIELWLPTNILNAAIEQAELYHFNDVDGLLIEAITDYLTHRDALPLTKG